MKKILILALFFTACKKKSVDADKNSPALAAPTCQSYDQLFVGQWICQASPNDTVKFVWTRNNCPINGQNYYKMVNFGKVAKENLSSLFNNDPEMKADEFNGKKIGEISEPYTFIQVIFSAGRELMMVTKDNKSISFIRVK